MTDLRGDVELGATSSEVRYPLERVEGKLTYKATPVSNQEGVPDIPVEASWPHGTPGGMGESVRTGPNSIGYSYGLNTDATKWGVIRFRGKRVQLGSGTTNGIDDKPTFAFLATDGTTEFVYFLNNDNAYKFSSDGSTITNETELQTANTVYGRPDIYGGTWYAPEGATNDARKLTSIAGTGAGADTWAAVSAGVKATVFAISVQGAVTSIHRALTNNVSISTDGSSFGDNFPCGDSGTVITSMAQGASGMTVAKRNNLGRLINGEWQQLTRFNEGDSNIDYGCGLLVPSGSDSAFYNHGGTLSFFDGLGVDNVSPETSPTYASHGTTTANPPMGLKFKETAYASDDWIYAIADRSTGGDNGDFILALNRRGSSQIWHTIYYGAVVTLRGLVVDSSQRLWFLDTTNDLAVHIQLGGDGSPYDSSAITKGEGSSSGTHYHPVTDFGYPTVLKQMRSVQLVAQGLDANNTLSLYESIDGAAFTQQADTASADGLKEFVYASAEAGYTFAYGILIIVNGSKDPRYTSLILRASLRPDRATRHEFAIDTRRKYADGSQPEWDGPKALSNLRALERAAPTKFRDTGGTQDDAMVNSVTIRETFVDATRTDYLLDVVVTSWEI